MRPTRLHEVYVSGQPLNRSRLFLMRLVSWPNLTASTRPQLKLYDSNDISGENVSRDFFRRQYRLRLWTDEEVRLTANVHDWTFIRVLLSLTKNLVRDRSRVAFAERNLEPLRLLKN